MENKDLKQHFEAGRENPEIDKKKAKLSLKSTFRK
jgi:hypothetical protein